MKKYIGLFLLVSIKAQACATYEAQITSTVKDIKYTSAYECVITLELDPRNPSGKWLPHFNCPLEKRDVFGKLITVKNCDLQRGGTVMGYLVKSGDELELE